MPRSLSGVRSGEFDTIEVTEKMTAHDLETQGSFSHTGTTAPHFQKLKLGQTPDEPEGSVRLVIDGDMKCSNFVTTGIEKTVTFSLADGSTKTYNGSADVTLSASEMTPTPTTPSTLTITQGGATLGTYDTSAPGPTINIPSPPPSPIVASLTHSSDQSVAVSETPTLLMSGFGVTLTPTASTNYLIEVQLFAEESSGNNEELTLTLTQDTSNTNAQHASHTVFFEKNVKQLISYRTVLTLSSGTHEVGLAFNTEPDNDSNAARLLFGGDYPDVVMSATVVNHTSTTYSSGG